jgi:protocatechuate 3,4-dioxygenase beta subunit
MSRNFVLIAVIVVLLIGALVLFNKLEIGTRQNTSQPESQDNPDAINSSSSDNSSSAQMSKDCTGKTIPELTEGPYYTPNTPERQTIRGENTPSVKLTLEGYVFDAECKPLANVWIDFWQADGEGIYDNSGYILRGHQYSDSEGKYRLETVIPGQYPGRTEHIHFKIRASESSRTITSQLFLPNSQTNSTDSIFDKSLVINISDNPNGEGKYATYNFIIER